jgi:hypothetical protein
VDDADCLPGQRCRELTRGGGAYRGCGYASADGPATETIDLGELELGAGRVGQVELATPPDAVSVTLQAARSGGDPLPLSFVSATDAAGVRLFDLEDVLELRDPPIRWLPLDTDEAVTMLVPNTTADRYAYTGGRLEWRVAPFPRVEGETGTARLRLEARVRRAPGGAPPGGRLALNVHFVDGVGPGAAGAPTDDQTGEALARLDALLAPAGLRLGAVRFFEVADRRYRILDSVEGPDSELAALFREGADRDGLGVDVFVVRSIEREGGGFASLGVSGGIPGPVGLHGTRHSGVVVAWDGLSARVVGHVLAHELAHYLGLYHTTERLRPCGPGETIEDGCAPFGGGDTLADTAHGDEGNLMYWSIVGDGDNDALSGGQSFVLRASALVEP